MFKIRDREIKRISDEDALQQQCLNIFDDVEGKPKSKLHQIYLLKAKKTQAKIVEEEEKLTVKTEKKLQARWSSPARNQYSDKINNKVVIGSA